MKTGEEFFNKNGRLFKILNKNLEKSDNKHLYYDIVFVESGYVDCVRGDSIHKGLVKDNLAKTCCDIGSVGYINTREHLHEYKIWENMLYRCYCKTDKSYKYYGEKGITVCQRWHRFDYFVEDIKKIVGFNQEKFDNYELKLDKDLLSTNAKIYSPQTTMWVSDLINQKRRANEYNTKHKKFAVFPDGHTEQIYHVSDFCKTYNLHRQNVYKCLLGEQKSTKDFKFYRE